MAVKEDSYYNNSEKLVKRVYIVKYYGHYGEKRYNFRICIVKIEDIDNSNMFKE